VEKLIKQVIEFTQEKKNEIALEIAPRNNEENNQLTNDG